MPDKVDEWLSTDLSKISPCVILCSPAMMDNGTSRMVLEKLASGENNRVILTGYCMVVLENDWIEIQDTIARRLRENESEIPVLNGRPNETIKVNCQVNTISFSAHSDYKGTRSLIHDLQPDHVVFGSSFLTHSFIVHGEASKMDDLATGLKMDLADRYNQGLLDVQMSRILHSQFYTPENMKSLQFSYNPPKFVKIIGRAADRQWASNTVVNGVLVKENFKYQLIDAQQTL